MVLLVHGRRTIQACAYFSQPWYRDSPEQQQIYYNRSEQLYQIYPTHPVVHKPTHKKGCKRRQDISAIQSLVVQLNWLFGISRPDITFVS